MTALTVNSLCCLTADLSGQKFTIDHHALLAALVKDRTIIPLEILYDQVWVSLLHVQRIIDNLCVDLFANLWNTQKWSTWNIKGNDDWYRIHEHIFTPAVK